MIIGVCLISLAALVYAQTPEEKEQKAKEYFEAGRRAYEDGNFATAAAAFAEANQLSPRPAIVFSMAQAHRQHYYRERHPDDLARAIELYEQYLEEEKGGRRNDALRFRDDLRREAARVAQDPPRIEPETAERRVKTELMISSRTPGALVSIDGSPPQDVPVIAEVAPGEHDVRVDADGFVNVVLKQTAVEGRLVVAEINLREKSGVVRVSAPDGARIIVDGRLQGEAPLLFPLQLPAGTHVIAVTDRGSHAFVRELTVGRGEDLAVVATLETTAQRDVSYYFLGGGAVLFAVTAGTVIGALVAEGRARFIQRKLLEERMNLTPAERDEFNDMTDLRGDLATASSALIAGSIALGLTGGLLYVFDDPGIESRRPDTLPEPTEVSLHPILTPDTAGVGLHGSF